MVPLRHKSGDSERRRRIPGARQAWESVFQAFVTTPQVQPEFGSTKHPLRTPIQTRFSCRGCCHPEASEKEEGRWRVNKSWILAASPMGLPARRWCGFAAVLCLCVSSSCNAEPIEPLPLPDTPARSLQCFEDGQVYGCCEESYRLTPSGMIGVPLWAVDNYCGGACVVETEDVLNCVTSALDGFRFYNGASVEDVRYALRRGCSHTFKRGDFNDLEPPLGDYPDIYGDNSGAGGRITTAPQSILALLGAAWLLLHAR